MSVKYRQGKFTIKNPEKFVGNKIPTYRSGWELAFMQFCDSHPNVIKWASECIRIPYRHPFTGKMTHYVPDFLVQYKDKNNKILSEVVEIKPKNQSIVESKNASLATKETVAINNAKWEQARKWCKANGLTFRVITENDIFRNGSR